MTRSSRKLGLALALAALAAPVAADVQDDFREGVDLYERGHKAEALAKFQAVLAADPSNEEAYELWKAADHHLFTDLLVEGGEYEKLTKRFLQRATLGRQERQNDADAINALVNSLKGENDSVERRRLLLTLAAEHGEFAVPRLLAALSDAGDADWRVSAMHVLTEMESDVVQPLLAALDTENTYQRKNIALVLGYIGDPRAAAYLSGLAETDGDEGVQLAAGQAAMKCNARGSALEQFLRLGEDYHYRRPNVLREFDYSRVLWAWQGGGLESFEVPRSIYNNELARRAYYEALALDGSSLKALAGIATECTDIIAKVEALAAAGEDTSDLQGLADEGSLAVAAAGLPAVDMALGAAVVAADTASAIHLIRAIGEMAAAPTNSLLSALDSHDGAIVGEAAVALGQIAHRTGQAAPANVVAVLGESAGREVVQIAIVIDSDADRAAATVAALEAKGVLVNHRSNGAQGVALISRVPGVDVIIIGDGLSDLTVDQVVVAAGDNPGTASTPVVLMTADSDLADAWSDRVAGTSSGADDLDAIDDAFAGGVTGDRAEADDIAGRAATVLAGLATSGHTDISFVLDELTGPLANRAGSVAIPCMNALAIAGSPDHLAALAQVVANSDREDDVRMAAANAMGGIFSRHATTADAGSALATVVADSGSSIGVRRAAASALGRLKGTDNAGLVNALRGGASSDG